MLTLLFLRILLLIIPQPCSAYSSQGHLNRQEVLLVYPGKYRAADPQVPLALLYLAASLQQEGFKVRLLDMRLTDYRQYEVGHPLFVGMSCMSGMQIKYALEFAGFVRQRNPKVLLVWGGVHPTLLPSQTIHSDLVDIVVRGEGELIIKDLATTLAQNEPLNSVKGLTHKDNGLVKNNPDGQNIDLDQIPIDLPYDLLEMGRYPAFRSGRFHIQTSRGCPHRCGFCYNTLFNKSRWRGKSAQRVIEEIQYIKAKYPNVKIIDPIDDNFFVDEYRVEQICKALIANKVEIKWRANCRFDYLANYDQEFLELLAESGCVELDFGGESGSERIQQLIHKDVTTEEILKSADNLRRYAPSIEPYVSWMIGLPEESDADLEMTFNLMDKMKEVNPKTQHYGIFVYTPFPSPIMNNLPVDFNAPKTLEEWGKIHVFHFDPPWHTKKRIRKLHTISSVTRIAFYPQARIKERALSYRVAYKFLNKIACYRWKHRNFSFPIELKLADTVAKYAKGFL